MSPKCLISCIAHNRLTSVALSEISPCKMTVTVGLVKSSSALLTSSLTKCPVFVDLIIHFLHLEILQTEADCTNCPWSNQSRGCIFLWHSALPCWLSLTLQLNVNMASALSAGILARCIIDPGPGGLLLLLKKGKQELGEQTTVASWWGWYRGHC